MNVWFVRCNGETAHNQPGTNLYMEGEPPKYPNRKFNYVDECLTRGFARVGFPTAGDLRDPKWRTRVISTYGDLIKPHQFGYLEQFATIEVGDLVLLPTYQERYQVHLGIVIAPRRKDFRGSWGQAYYYYYNISAGDWYDCAHRVDAQWANRPDGTFRGFHVPEIGGTWLRGFGQVISGSQKIIQLAKDSGLV